MAVFKNSKADLLKPTVQGGVFIPQAYTTAERDALTNVVAGSIILNTTTNKLNAYLNGAWEAITSA